ncbi:MAG: hypothetical protein NVSMB64_19570 [Candidatus Velthaea sp.]
MHSFFCEIRSSHYESQRTPEGKISALEWAKLELPKTTFLDGFTVTINRLDTDGSAHAHLSTSSKRGPLGLALEATVTPDGQIVPKVDFAVIKAAGADQNNPGAMIPTRYRSWTQAEQANFWAFVADRRMILFNEVALGTGKKKSFSEGDSWRIVIPDQNNEIVNFVFQGTQHFQGRDVAVLGVRRHE